MKLNLAIIHLDMVIKTLPLEPGEYTIGRSSDNNIVVQHFSLDPEQGMLFCEEDQWFYKDKKTGKTTRINNAETLRLSSQVELATQAFVESGQTRLTNIAALQNAQQSKVNKRIAIVTGLVALLLASTLIGYQTFRTGRYPVNQSNLLNRVRDKIVEFEVTRDGKAIEDLKKYSGLQDTDFKDSSGFCTGFLMGPNIVLTAAHCLLGRLVIDLNNDFYLKTSDGKQHKILEVLGFDVKRDFLYLRTEGMESYGHLDFADGYSIEQKIYTVGNVHGEGIAIRDGIISSESTDADDPSVKFIRYSAGTSPGNSGGPLLNENGEVVALVFASTYSENFNLGTPVADLVEAYNQYVKKSDEAQKVTLQMKRVLNFRAAPMLQALSLPYLPQFDEYPEVSEKFNDIAIEVDVPIPFDQVDEIVLKPLNDKVINTFKEVQEILKSNKEIVLDWKSFVTDETPAILPSQFDHSQNVFVKKEGRYYPYVAGIIDSPSKADFKKYKEQLKKEEKFDFQAIGYNIYIADRKIDLLANDIFYKPKDASGNKQRLQNLSYGAPHAQLLLVPDEDLRRDGFFSLKLFMKNFAGQAGVLANAASRFVRPQAMKDFTINNFDFENEEIKEDVVKDRMGREWRRSHVKLFESINIYTYCKDLPEGPFCIGRVFNIYNDNLLTIIEDNFRQFILSHLLINPYFWEKSQLLAFMKEGKNEELPLMRGIKLTSSGKSLKGSLSGFPFEFEVPAANKVESIRLQTGLYGNYEKADWTGYGMQWVKRGKKKDQVCGLGVEPFKAQSAFILNYLRDRRKQEKLKKIKGEDAQPLPGVWHRPFRGGDTPFQIFGYCAPLEEDPRISGQYFVDFKNAKPLKYKHKVKQ